MRFYQEFMEGIRTKIGNGQKTKFLVDKWCGGCPLRQAFPSVYLLASNLQAFVSNYLEIRNSKAIWHPILRRPMFDWEVSTIASLLGNLEEAWVNPIQEDRKI